MDTAHCLKSLVQSPSVQSSLTRACVSSNNQHFDCLCLLRKHSTSTIHPCQSTTASYNCTDRHPLGREDSRFPKVLGKRHGHVCAVKDSPITPALELCKSCCTETVLYFRSIPHQQLMAHTARKGILYFRALVHKRQI